MFIYKGICIKLNFSKIELWENYILNPIIKGFNKLNSKHKHSVVLVPLKSVEV